MSQSADRYAVVMLELAALAVGRYRAREEDEDEDVEKLAGSIADQGLQQPLTVAEIDGTYHLIAGHRRYDACVRAGLHRVPCHEVSGDEKDLKAIMFSENFYRRDMTPIQEARQILEVLEGGIMTIEEVANVHRRSTEWVRKRVVMLTWPQECQRAVQEGQISASAMHYLSQIEDEEYRKYAIESGNENGMTGYRAKVWAQAWKAKKTAREAAADAIEASNEPTVWPVTEIPCLLCRELRRPDSMNSVLVCPDCMDAVQRHSGRAGGGSEAGLVGNDPAA